jgi:hypothetical protein
MSDTALHAHAFMAADVPRARYESCVTRLELLAVDDPGLLQKVEILRSKLEVHRGRVRSNNIVLTIVGVAMLAGVVAIGVWLVREIFG